MCYSLAAAGNKSTTRPPLPPLGCRGGWKETGRKLLGRDKGSLTEQQTMGPVTKPTIQIRGKQNRLQREQLSLTRPPHHAPKLQVSSRRSTSSPTGTQRDGTWYGIPCSVWPGEVSPPGYVPSWILVKINPVLAKPRTLSISYSIPSTSCQGPPLSS